jgi:Squalene-hopene cyclase C-terminal domain/Prenyltransferase and squalene oxidase repeat
MLSTAFALCLSCVVPAARAIHSSDALDRVVRYLQDDQNLDGGFGGEKGEASNSDFTAWVALALAAAGVNPRSQAREHGIDAYAYLTDHVGALESTTDYERELLVVDAAGTEPSDFGGVDLVKEILARQIAEPQEQGIAFPHEAGSPTAGMNDTIFAIIALSPIAEPTVQRAVQQAATWVEREQNLDGSWPATCPKTVAACSRGGREPEGEADMTAAAIEALNAAGRHDTTAQAKALEYLHATQDLSEGGFAESLGAHQTNADSSLEANAASTAWATQAIWAAGQNPEDWDPAGVDPLTYMESMQQADGHVRWKRSRDLNGVWMTAYAGPALAGVPLPIPAVPYTPPPAPGQTGSGDGGSGAQSGSGVTAGGGGDGARLFSRPQPQSQGRTPGGARVLASRRVKSASRRREHKHRRNPSPPRMRSVPTLPATPSEAGDSLGSARTRAAAARAGGGTKARRKGRRLRAARPAPAVSAAMAAGRRRSSERETTGVLVGSSSAPGGQALQPGAPSLHEAGKSQSAWLAIAIAGAALALALSGSLLERRRPPVAP